MPLTLQLYGSDLKNTGTFHIERNNMLFYYSFDQNNSRSFYQAIHNRDRLRDSVLEGESRLADYRSKDRGFAMTEDPRHDVLGHLSHYDRHDSAHFHVILSEDVNLIHLKLFFKDFSTKGIEDLISEECVNYILETAEQYFLEFKKSNIAQENEMDYLQQKDKELRKVVEIQTSVDKNNLTQNNNNNNNQIAPISNSLFLNLAGLLTQEDDNHRSNFSTLRLFVPVQPASISIGTIFIISVMPTLMVSQQLAEDNEHNFNLFFTNDASEPESPRPGRP